MLRLFLLIHLALRSSAYFHEFQQNTHTAWRVSIFGVILVRIFPHLDWIRRDTPYFSVFSPNAGNAGQNNSEYRHYLYSVTTSRPSRISDAVTFLTFCSSSAISSQDSLIQTVSFACKSICFLFYLFIYLFKFTFVDVFVALQHQIAISY